MPGSASSAVRAASATVSKSSPFCAISFLSSTSAEAEKNSASFGVAKRFSSSALTRVTAPGCALMPVARRGRARG